MTDDCRRESWKAAIIGHCSTENNRMFRTPQFLHSLLTDETGGEVMEYAIVAGLISIAAIAVIGSFGVKVLARWNSVNSSM
jgi:pilus assembly protein Flp/PilA